MAPPRHCAWRRRRPGQLGHPHHLRATHACPRAEGYGVLGRPVGGSFGRLPAVGDTLWRARGPTPQHGSACRRCAPGGGVCRSRVAGPDLRSPRAGLTILHAKSLSRGGAAPPAPRTRDGVGSSWTARLGRRKNPAHRERRPPSPRAPISPQSRHVRRSIQLTNNAKKARPAEHGRSAPTSATPT